MLFSDIPDGTRLFVDANIFVYWFAPDPDFGPPSAELFERIEEGRIFGITSAHVLSNVAHRCMTLEACADFGWPFAGIARRMKRQPTKVQQLQRYRHAVGRVIEAELISIAALTSNDLSLAMEMSGAYGLLFNDALILAIMRAQGITDLASHDADFDHVSWVRRYAPV